MSLTEEDKQWIQRQLEPRFSRLDDYLLQFRGEMVRRLDVVDQRLDYLSNTVASIDMRLAPMSKAILDFGVLAGQLTREQARTVDTSNDLAARVAILDEKISRLINPAP